MSIKILNNTFKIQSATKQILIKSSNTVHVLAPASYASSLQIVNNLSTEVANRISGDNQLYSIIYSVSGQSLSGDSFLSSKIDTISASNISNYSTIVTVSGSLDSKVEAVSAALKANDEALLGTIQSVSASLNSKDNTLLATIADVSSALSAADTATLGTISNISAALETEIYNYDLANTQQLINYAVSISGDQTIYGDKSFAGNVVVEGDLILNGGSISTSSEHISSSYNIITLNAGGTKPISEGYSGIYVERGSDPADGYYFTYEEARQGFTVGLSGQTQMVATREDIPLANSLQYYDAVSYSLKSSNVIFANGNSTFGGNVTIYATGGTWGEQILLQPGGSTAARIAYSASGGYRWTTGIYDPAGIAPFTIRYEEGSLDVLNLSRNGTATFSGTILTPGNIRAGLIELGNGGEIRLPGYDGDTDIAINYTGYNGGTTRFRSVKFYDGKQSLVATIDGATKAATFGGSVRISSSLSMGTLSVPSLRQSNFGYGSGYSATVIGSESSSNNSNICLGVDPAAIAGGSFGGYGGELFLRRNVILMQPNSGSTDWEKANLTFGTANLYGNLVISPPADTGTEGIYCYRSGTTGYFRQNFKDGWHNFDYYYPSANDGSWRFRYIDESSVFHNVVTFTKSQATFNNAIYALGGSSDSEASPAIRVGHRQIISFADSGGNPTSFIWSDVNNYLNFGTANNTRMTLRTNGSVHINGFTYINHASSGNNAAYIRNTSSDGYGPAFGGGGASGKYLASFENYASATLALITEDGSVETNGDLLTKSALYLGTNRTTDGAWRFRRENSNLGLEVLVDGVWTLAHTWYYPI